MKTIFPEASLNVPPPNPVIVGVGSLPVWQNVAAAYVKAGSSFSTIVILKVVKLEQVHGVV